MNCGKERNKESCCTIYTLCFKCIHMYTHASYTYLPYINIFLITLSLLTRHVQPANSKCQGFCFIKTSLNKCKRGGGINRQIFTYNRINYA